MPEACQIIIALGRGARFLRQFFLVRILGKRSNLVESCKWKPIFPLPACTVFVICHLVNVGGPSWLHKSRDTPCNFGFGKVKLLILLPLPEYWDGYWKKINAIRTNEKVWKTCVVVLVFVLWLKIHFLREHEVLLFLMRLSSWNHFFVFGITNLNG